MSASADRDCRQLCLGCRSEEVSLLVAENQVRERVKIVRGRANPGGKQQGYRGVGVRVLFSNPSYTLTLKQGTLYPYPFLRVRVLEASLGPWSPEFNFKS